MKTIADTGCSICGVRRLVGRTRRCKDHLTTGSPQLPLGFELEQIKEPVSDKTMSLWQRAEAFDAMNPQVRHALERLTLDLIDQGVKRISVKFLFEVLRVDYSIQTQGDQYKLNNSLTCYYNRHLAALPFVPKGTFELRARRAA